MATEIIGSYLDQRKRRSSDLALAPFGAGIHARLSFYTRKLRGRDLIVLVPSVGPTFSLKP